MGRELKIQSDASVEPLEAGECQYCGADAASAEGPCPAVGDDRPCRPHEEREMYEGREKTITREELQATTLRRELHALATRSGRATLAELLDAAKPPRRCKDDYRRVLVNVTYAADWTPEGDPIRAARPIVG